jgi:hypothetical protein
MPAGCSVRLGAGRVAEIDEYLGADRPIPQAHGVFTMNARVGCPAASLQEQLAGQPEPERASFLLSLIRAEVAAVVGEKTPLINAESPWRQLGIYREFATELRGRLAAATGQRIPATVFFDYPTPAALMGYLRAELLGERIVLAPPAREGTRPGDDPIAIVGMACRFPGGVRSPEQLWHFVAAGGDAVEGHHRRVRRDRQGEPGRAAQLASHRAPADRGGARRGDQRPVRSSDRGGCSRVR